MATQRAHECQNCKRLEAAVAQLKDQLALQQVQIAELLGRIAKLEKNSSNSHKPPSSDIVKPKQAKKQSGKKRKIGAQPGHSRHERTPFTPDQIDQIVHHSLDGPCPGCGGVLQASDQEQRVLLQQVELVQKPVLITEHRAPVYWCAKCQKSHHARLPDDIRRAGLVGPRLTALACWFKGAAHVSYSTIQALFSDVMGVHLSTGHLVHLVGKGSVALDSTYTALLDALPNETRLNVDETGHKECGKKLWTWVFRSPHFTAFKINESRGSQVLLDVLGEEFDGVLGCDYFSAYRKYMKDVGCQVQFCLAHLIRDVKFLTMLDGRTRKYGKRLLLRLRRLFGVFHRRERMRPDLFQQALERQRKGIMHVATHPPPSREAENIAERFRCHGESYLRFITTPCIEPTNNLAEQALRFVVLQRRMTQGTRGASGRSWCERIWTVAATCRQQKRSIYDYLHSALHAHFAGQPAPSLLSA